MSISAGGMIKQTIHKDEVKPQAWHAKIRATFNVQILNSETFRQITGNGPPHSPVDVKAYVQAGLPFFSMYEETSNIKGDFSAVKSVGEIDGAHEPTAKPHLHHLDHRSSNLDARTFEAKFRELIEDKDGILNPEGPLRDFRTLQDLVNELAEEQHQSFR